MDTRYIAAALMSALLHAAWNAAIKSRARTGEAMGAQMIASALMSVPLLAWTGLPAAASWPWLLATTLINLVAVTALLRAYELGGFGAVYPFARAISVVCVVPFAALLAGERLGWGATAGVVLVGAALATLGLGAGRDRSVTPASLGWTAMAGLATEIVVLIDAQGVRRSGSALAYGATAAITNALAMMLRQRRIANPSALMRAHWHVAVPAGFAAMASYLLILWVYTRAPIAAASALRDTSAVFAVMIAVIWLKEDFTRAKIVATCLVVSAIPLLRLG
jgi:drug/metabolite transporter (DMT)-like permease